MVPTGLLAQKQSGPLMYEGRLLDSGMAPNVLATISDIGEVTLLVNTGTPKVVLDEALLHDKNSDSLTSAAENSISSRGSNGAQRIRLGPLHYDNTTIYPVDMHVFKSYLGAEFRGLLGWEILCQKLLIFDFDRGRWAIGDHFPSHLTSSTSYPTQETQTGAPTLNAIIANREHAFVLDTFFNGELTLDPETYQQWRANGIIHHISSEGSTISISAVNQKSRGVLTRGTLLGVDLKGVEVSSAKHSKPQVGMEFLRRFNFVVDGPNRRIHVQPRAKIAPALAADYVLGARFLYSDNEVVIQSLNPKGGPSNDAGLKAGDEILVLGELAAKDINYLSVFELCQKHPGGPLVVTYRRDGQTAKATVQIDPSKTAPED